MSYAEFDGVGRIRIYSRLCENVAKVGGILALGSYGIQLAAHYIEKLF